MKTAIASLASVSPYSQSRQHDLPYLPKELADAYDQRTWREHAHFNDSGNVFIPPMAFKNCLSECAKYLGVQVPGKGKATYTKNFEAGVLVVDGLDLGVNREDLEHERLYLNADGRRGGNKRVWKRYPVIRKWSGEVSYLIFDPLITEDVFEQHLAESGRFIGIGRFRPRNNGFYGRFEVKGIKWS